MRCASRRKPQRPEEPDEQAGAGLLQVAGQEEHSGEEGRERGEGEGGGGSVVPPVVEPACDKEVADPQAEREQAPAGPVAGRHPGPKAGVDPPQRVDGGDVAADDGGHVAGADLLPADQRDLRGLDHGIGRLDHGDQALGLDHSQRLSHSSLA